jgi:hypothetical protein
MRLRVWKQVLPVAVSMTALMLFANCGGSDAEESERNYVISFDADDCVHNVALTLGPPATGTSTLQLPRYVDSFAYASNLQFGFTELVFMTAGTSGSQDEPGPGWLFLRLLPSAKAGDTLALGTSSEFGLWFYDEQTSAEHAVLDGTMTVEVLSIVPDESTSFAFNYMDGGTFDARVTIAGATLDLGDGVRRPLAGSISSSGSHVGTKPPPSGGGSGDSVVRFTCRESNVCVEYSITDAARARSTRGRCASSSDGHSCNRSNARTCLFANDGPGEDGDTLCAVTSSAPSDHDQSCRANGGSLGC